METLREWIIMESEYQTVVHETVYGFQKTNKQSGWRIHNANTGLGYCKRCGKKHTIWQCDVFKYMNKEQKWGL